eukprot:Polyplicarium_translucidae@DN1743_c0_g1_i3.p1
MVVGDAPAEGTKTEGAKAEGTKEPAKRLTTFASLYYLDQERRWCQAEVEGFFFITKAEEEKLAPAPDTSDVTPVNAAAQDATTSVPDATPPKRSYQVVILNQRSRRNLVETLSCDWHFRRSGSYVYVAVPRAEPNATETATESSIVVDAQSEGAPSGPPRHDIRAWRFCSGEDSTAAFERLSAAARDRRADACPDRAAGGNPVNDPLALEPMVEVEPHEAVAERFWSHIGAIPSSAQESPTANGSRCRAAQAGYLEGVEACDDVADPSAALHLSRVAALAGLSPAELKVKLPPPAMRYLLTAPELRANPKAAAAAVCTMTSLLRHFGLGREAARAAPRPKPEWSLPAEPRSSPSTQQNDRPKAEVKNTAGVSPLSYFDPQPQREARAKPPGPLSTSPNWPPAPLESNLLRDSDRRLISLLRSTADLPAVPRPA